MITLNNLRELIQLQVSFILTLLIESEIIFTLCSASHLLVKNSETDQENSQLCSTNAQLIGSCHGHKKPWFRSLSLSSKNSLNLILLKKQRTNLWNIWVTFILWSLKFAMSISLKCVVKFISHQNLISHIFKHIKNFI